MSQTRIAFTCTFLAICQTTPQVSAATFSQGAFSVLATTVSLLGAFIKVFRSHPSILSMSAAAAHTSKTAPFL